MIGLRAYLTIGLILALVGYHLFALERAKDAVRDQERARVANVMSEEVQRRAAVQTAVLAQALQDSQAERDRLAGIMSALNGSMSRLRAAVTANPYAANCRRDAERTAAVNEALSAR